MTNEIDKFASEIVVVTVSYGDRSSYLLQLVSRLIELKITKVVIVDNNMSENSKKDLCSLKQHLGGAIELLHNTENVGSAKAFKLGLIRAGQYRKYKYVLLMDDDNLPDKNLIKILGRDWARLGSDDCLVALACNRVDFGTNERVVANDEPWLLLGKKDSFLGFHIAEVLKKIWHRLFNAKLTNKACEDSKQGIIYFAPYGGLFFHKSVLDRIGYPNEDYIVYADDCEFSYRITLLGGSIYALLDAKIFDMDGRGSIAEYRNIYNYYGNYYDRIRTYYTLRNAIHFHYNHYSNAKIIFIVNLLLYYFLCMYFIFLRHNYHRLPIFINSFVDGIFGKLGNRKGYDLSMLDAKESRH